jgi:hypothetical protein
MATKSRGRTSAYPATEPTAALKLAPRSRSIDGSATFTIVTSTSNMKIAMQLASRAHHLRSARFRDHTGVFLARCWRPGAVVEEAPTRIELVYEALQASA